MNKVTELIDYKCADCGSEKWIVKVGHRTDGTTWLIISCANPKCVEAKKKELGLDDADAMIVWDEFDITGQGHDEQDLDSFSNEMVN